MSTEILETSPLYQLWVARGQAQGREQGIEQGLEQGLEQGREQGIEQGMTLGLREAVLIVLRRRFGEPPGDLVEALAGASTADLHEIVVLAAIGSLEEVRARLGL